MFQGPTVPQPSTAKSGRQGRTVWKDQVRDALHLAKVRGSWGRCPRVGDHQDTGVSGMKESH